MNATAWRASTRLAILRAVGARLPSAAPLQSTPARILVIRPDHIGDVLLTAPAVTLLRRAFPTARIVALVGPWGREVAERSFEADEIRAFEFPGFTRQRAAWIGQPYLDLRWSARLRAEAFDVAVLARPDHWWGAMLAAFAGIPHRVGYAVPECAPFLTRSLEEPPAAHAAELSLRLAREVCRMAEAPEPSVEPGIQFRIDPAETREAQALLDVAAPNGSGPLVLLHPGAGTELKLWPPERWARVLDAVRERLGARTVIVAGGAEADLVTSLQRAAQRPHGVVRTDRGLGILAAVLARADVVVGSDNGPLHLAGAVGVPTVRIFGPTDPARFGPWPDSNRNVVLRPLTPCSPCGHVSAPPCGALRHPWCLMEQTPDEVVESIAWTLRQARG